MNQAFLELDNVAVDDSGLLKFVNVMLLHPMGVHAVVSNGRIVLAVPEDPESEISYTEDVGDEVRYWSAVFTASATERLKAFGYTIQTFGDTSDDT